MGKEYHWNKRYLYKLTFPNGMVYIGCTWNVKDRWAGNGAHYNHMPKMAEAIREYGWENIEKEVICCLPDGYENSDAIKALEKEFIKAYSGRCYNSSQNMEWQESLATRERYEKRKVYWTAFGETKPMTEWCKQFNISSAGVAHRMEKHGLTLEQALSFPHADKGINKAHIVEYWRSCGCDI